MRRLVLPDAIDALETPLAVVDPGRIHVSKHSLGWWGKEHQMSKDYNGMADLLTVRIWAGMGCRGSLQRLSAARAIARARHVMPRPDGHGLS